ncbi:MAG: hypothetical protein ABIQ82_06580 [Variovorax sp.]
MHSAPSVSFPVGRSRFAGHLLMVIWTAGACCAGVVCYQFESVGWRGAVLLASVLVAGAAAGLAYWRQCAGELHFDGQGWRLAGADPLHAARLLPALDLQSLMLVRLAAPGQRPRWCWLERRSAPHRWLDLRRAVYSRAPSADPADPNAAVSQRSASPGPSPSSS